MPLDSIGVMTMKMMSNTSITSTIGVTLMSATGGGALNFTFSPVIVSLPGIRQKPGSPDGLPANQLADPNESDYLRTPRCERSVSYTHLRAHETRHELVCRLLLDK